MDTHSTPSPQAAGGKTPPPSIAFLEAQLASLRAERGKALADGEPFDHGQIIEAEQRLAAALDLDSEQARRDRAGTARLTAERKAEATAKLRDAEARRREALDKMQTAIRAFVDAANDRFDLEMEMRPLFAQIGRPVPLTLRGERISQRMAACLTRLKDRRNGRYRMGSGISFKPAQYQADEDWVEGEAINLDELVAPNREKA